MFPVRPHQYQQGFPRVTPEIAWQKHLDAEQFLIGRFGLKMQPLSLPYEQLLIKALTIRMRFIRSIPFYPFRAIYWYFISRKTAAYRSIQEQYSTMA